MSASISPAWLVGSFTDIFEERQWIQGGGDSGRGPRVNQQAADSEHIPVD